MKKWKDVYAIVGSLISYIGLSVFLLSIPCWLCGYKHIFHVILPAKIQGLGGIKLDKPFINKNVSCVNTPFKSINAEVTYRNGKAYVRTIHAESTRELSYILSLLEEKYGKPTRIKDSDSYFFEDWRSWNYIVVTPDPSLFKSSSETLRQFFPPPESNPWSQEFGQEQNKVLTVKIDVFGQLWHEECEKVKSNEEERRKHDLNSL